MLPARGLSGLEAAEIPTPSRKKGIGICWWTVRDADVVRSVMEKDIELTAERHAICHQVFRSLGDLGPAMGMIGTLVAWPCWPTWRSQVHRPAMAVALLTTSTGASRPT